MVVLRSLTFATALALAGPVQAHVSLSPTKAAAGAYQVLRFGVGHGCDGKPTRALRLEIPKGVVTARPQPKPGWGLDVQRTADGTPTAITWTGALAADEFDEFLVLVRLPAAAGPLAFPALQSCEGAEVRWVETAPPGAPRPAKPAPVLTLEPAAAPQAGHDHHR